MVGDVPIRPFSVTIIFKDSIYYGRSVAYLNILHARQYCGTSTILKVKYSGDVRIGCSQKGFGKPVISGTEIVNFKEIKT